MSRCNIDAQKLGEAYPRTCAVCGLGPCPNYPPERIKTVEIPNELLSRLIKALEPMSEIARISDLYIGPPCYNKKPLPDDHTVGYYQHGYEPKNEVEITLGKCRAAHAVLAELIKLRS